MRSLSVSTLAIASFALILNQAQASDQLDALFRRSVISMQSIATNVAQFPGQTFVKTDGWLSTIDVANDGTIFGVNGWGNIYRRPSVTAGWQGLPGGLAQASTGGKSIAAGVNSQGRIYTWNETKNQWNDVTLPSYNQGKQVSIGSDETMYALNTFGDVFFRNYNSWEKVTGNCVQIDVADRDTVMCVNGEGKLFQYIKHVWLLVSAPAILKSISISSQKHAVALDAAGNVYYKSFYTPSWNWSIVPNIKLAYASVSNTMIVGLDFSGNVFYMNL